MAHLAVETLLDPTAPEVADANEANDPTQHLTDEVTHQERVQTCYQMLHLAKHDVLIEWVAWLLVLSLLFTTIWLAGML